MPQHLGENPQLRSASDQPRSQEPSWRKRGQVQMASLQKIALGLFVPRNKFPLQIQVVDEPPHRFRETWELRAGLKEKTISPDGLDHTARTVGSLKNQRPQPHLLQAKCTRQARQAGANDHDFFRVSHRKESLSKAWRH